MHRGQNASRRGLTRKHSIALSRAERVGLILAFICGVVVWVCIGMWLATGADAAAWEPYDTGWVNLTPETGWSTFAGRTPGYRRIGSILHFRGLVNGGSSGSRVFTLPTEFCPTENEEAQGPVSGEFTSFHAVFLTNCEVLIYKPEGEAYGFGGMFLILPALDESGAEGKEGKEGAKGEPGEKGEKGEAGVKGEGGGESESGSGGVKYEVTNFGPEAEATLSEGTELIELIGWCVIGTLLAGALGFMTWRLVAS